MGKWWLLLGALTLLPPGAGRVAAHYQSGDGGSGRDTPIQTVLGWLSTCCARSMSRKVSSFTTVSCLTHALLGLVQRGEADAFVGAYPNEVPQVLFPRWHYDADQINALGLIDKPVAYTRDAGALSPCPGRGGTAIRKYLPNVREFREVHRRGGILGMLDHGHADFFIDASTEVEDVLTGSDRPQDYRITKLIRLPLYLGFVDDARGRELAAIYDRRLQELVRSGALRPLFKRWDAPYPFDKELEKPYVLP